MSEALEIGMPRKVFTLAITMGAHGDCLIAEYRDCCVTCRDLMSTAFVVAYGEPGLRPLGEVLDEVFEDMIRDRDV